MNIQIKTNYNTVLFHHIDSVSRWDQFIADHHWEHFQNQFEANDVTLGILNDYTKNRKALGWDAESELLGWAYDGFPEDQRFSPLLKPIREIEKLRDKNGNPLSQTIKRISKKLEQKSHELDTEHLKYDEEAEEILKGYEKIFELKKERTLNCYLTHSPAKDSLQGGANGEDIYVELFPDQNGSYHGTVSTIFHEAFHKILDVRSKLKKEFTEKGYKNLLAEIPELYPGPAHEYLDEVVIHSLTNVFIFNEDPENNIQHYSSSDETHKTHYAGLWRGVKYFEKFLSPENVKLLSPDQFFEGLAKKFELFIKEELYKKQS